MKITQKIRGKVTRKRKSIILIQCEGKNKTEEIYFSNFRKNSLYTICFAKGNYTDPTNMVKSLIKEINDRGLNKNDNDKAYCVFDTDIDSKKQLQINEAYKLSKKNTIIELIKSNPCFEIWFLLHFKNTTKIFNSNENVIQELRKVLPNYEKNKDYYDLLENKTKDAIENAKFLEKYHSSFNKNIIDISCNPSTEVYRIVEELNLISIKDN